MKSHDSLVSLEDILTAKTVIAYHIVATPLIPSTNLGKMLNVNLHFIGMWFQIELSK